MAEPTSQYYIFQYQDTHTQRYNMMYQLALQELQADYTQRAAIKEQLQKENEKLLGYIGNLERDLTDYISEKGKLGKADADKELALMRMYVDIEKAKATQSAQKQARKLDAQRMVQGKYGVPTTMSRAIVGADDAIGTRAAVATNETQLSTLIKGEVGKIVVSNPGSPSALAAAQETYAKVKDTADRKGVGGFFNDAEIRSFISSHYGLGSYTPPKSGKKDKTKHPDFPVLADPLDYDLGRIEQYEVDIEVGKQYAATGGLTDQANQVKGKLDEIRGTAEGQALLQSTLGSLRASGDYGMLIRSLSDDGKVTEDEYALFTERLTDSKQTPAAVVAYDAIKDGSRIQVDGKEVKPTIDLKSLSIEEQLIFDDQFLRKLGNLDSSVTRQGKVQKKIDTPLARPTVEQATQRARELYNPIRMSGSPETGQTFTLTDPRSGKEFQATADDMIKMQQDFERVLDENPDFERNFAVIGRAQELSGRIKPPSKTADQTGAEYLGYQIYQQYKANPSVFTPAEITSLASQLGGDQTKTDAILTNFHAYNMQAAMAAEAPPRDTTGAANQFLEQMRNLEEAQRKGIEVEKEAVRKRAAAIDVEGAQAEFDAAKAAERGGFLGLPIFRSEEAKAAQEKFLTEKSELSAAEQQRQDILNELKQDALLIERYRLAQPEIEPVVPKQPAPDVQPAGEKPEAKAALVAPEPFRPITDGGMKSWEFNPQAMTITYIKADGTLGDTVYDATGVLQGTAGNKASQAWAKENATTITELANQQALYNAQEKE